MKQITIESGRVRAVIVPDFGAAVTHLSVDGREVLYFNPENLGTANVLSGGIPLLFPFVSMSRDNEIHINAERYTMPVHGFAKEMPFEPVRVWKSGCELQLQSNRMTHCFYPFDFVLRVIYEAEDRGLKTTLSVRNDSQAVMPFAAGFHPYFLATDRAQTKFIFDLKEGWDYLNYDAQGNPLHMDLKGEFKLSQDYDAVFWNGNADCELINPADGYRARLSCNHDFPVITIWTMMNNAACIEPWQARPGAIERDGECRQLQAGETGTYSYNIYLDTI